jgi:hypothetical protein
MSEARASRRHVVQIDLTGRVDRAAPDSQAEAARRTARPSAAGRASPVLAARNPPVTRTRRRARMVPAAGHQQRRGVDLDSDRQPIERRAAHPLIESTPQLRWSTRACVQVPRPDSPLSRKRHRGAGVAPRTGHQSNGDRCWWLAADFDGRTAMLDALAYLKAARAAGVPAGLEVSPSEPARTSGYSSRPPSRRRRHVRSAVGCSGRQYRSAGT